MGDIIEISGLKKSFGEVKAVDDITFSVAQGSLFAFLGLNGAGKSTTINIVCTQLQKDGGKVTVAGHDLDSDPFGVRSSIGVVFQGSILDRALTVRDNLTIRAGLYGISGQRWNERLKELQVLLELDEILNRPYGKLSGGQRRRVDVARGLIHRPEVLILDEPTTGLDPSTRKTVWDVIENLRRQNGMTVFLTTHYMEESAAADDVVILDSGKIAAHGTPVALKDRYSSDYVKLYTARSDATEARLQAYEFLYENNHYRVKVNDSAQAKSFVVQHSDMLEDFEIVKGNMDDVFLNVTGKRLIGGEQA